MVIALGSDHAGVALKQLLSDYLTSTGRKCTDFGTYTEESVDYPDLVPLVTRAVQEETCNLAILICGTGIGMSITANKHRGIRAALCGDPLSARLAREHNNANVLALGSRIIGPDLAVEITESFLKGKFAGGRHIRRLEKIAGMDK